MCNGIPRLLRVRLFAILSAIALLVPFQAVSAARPLSPAAATCGDVVINEVLFDASANYGDEWVELYVVNTLPAGTVLKVEDDDSGGSDFVAEFTLAEEIVADRYIVIHAKDEAGSQEPTAGSLNIFDAGDGTHDLANTNENVGLSVFGTICEEVYWESNAGDNSPAFAAPIISVFTGSGSIANGESIARSPNSTGAFVAGTTDGLTNAAEGQSIGRNNDDGTLAVTLGYFLATRDHGTVHIAWQTATETGNAGFNLLAETADGEIVQINPELIASSVIDSVEPTDYTYSIATDADLFYVQEVGIDGPLDEIGPFAVGETYGIHVESPITDQEIDMERALYLPFVQR